MQGSRSLILIVVLLCFIKPAFAQLRPGTFRTPPIPSEAKLIYTKENSFSGLIHSGGFGVGYKFSKLSDRSGFRKRSYVFEFATMKHPKEVKLTNQFYDNAKSFVFGRKNVFMLLRTGIGADHLLFDKSQKDGVEIGVNIEGGASLGLLKPVYLDVFVQEENGFVIESQRYDKDKHPRDVIYGGSGFFLGLDEIKLHPGGYAKAALSFDWAKEDTKVLCLETGVAVDIYPKKVPIFAVFEKDINKNYFITFFAKVSFGKKRIN